MLFCLKMTYFAWITILCCTLQFATIDTLTIRACTLSKLKLACLEGTMEKKQWKKKRIGCNIITVKLIQVFISYYSNYWNTSLWLSIYSKYWDNTWTVVTVHVFSFLFRLSLSVSVWRVTITGNGRRCTSHFAPAPAAAVAMQVQYNIRVVQCATTCTPHPLKLNVT